MHDIAQERRRRVEQFADYLRRMHERTHLEARGSCFMIFQENPDGDADDDPALEEKILIEALVGEGPDGAGAGAGDDRAASTADESWREGRGNRFVQFSFERNWFCMDLPRQTLAPAEAGMIFRDRSGFFYLREFPQFTLYEEDTDGYDPFRKIYLYGDEYTAAEDMAYIFFTMWKFPLDARVYVRACCFGDGPTWEQDEAVE